MTKIRAGAPVPPQLEPYVEVLGEDLAVRFFLAFGGAELYFAGRPSGRSRLVDVVGYEKAVELGRRVGPGHLRVPLAKPYIAAHMYAQNTPIAEIARVLHTSDVTVRRMLPDRETRQLDLFG